MTITQAEATSGTSTLRLRPTTWAAYATGACTLAYGALKLYWAIGGTALLDAAPLDPKTTHASWFMPIGLWGTDVLAVVGIVVALATARPWGRNLPRRLLLIPAWMACAFMIPRAVAGLIQDALLLTGVTTVAAQDAALTHRLTRWYLLLWSPYFLIWGILWGVTAWSYRCGSRPQRAG